MIEIKLSALSKRELEDAIAKFGRDLSRIIRLSELDAASVTMTISPSRYSSKIQLSKTALAEFKFEAPIHE